MPQLKLTRDLFSNQESETFILPAGVSLGEWLMEEFPRGFHGPVAVFLEGEMSKEIPEEEICSFLTREEDNYHLIVQPAGGLVKAVANITLAPFRALGNLFSGLMPDLEGVGKDTNRYDEDQASPNNALKGQTNRVRLNARIPDIIGKVKSIPDLIVPSYDLWFGRKQILYEYFCIGMGYYDVTEEKISDQDITDLTGATATKYNPDTRPPTTLDADGLYTGLLHVEQNENVDDITLLALNELSITDNVTFRATGNKIYLESTNASNPPLYIQSQDAANANNNKTYRVSSVQQATNPVTAATEYEYTISSDTPVGTNEGPSNLEIFAYETGPARRVGGNIASSTLIEVEEDNAAWILLEVGQLYRLDVNDDQPFRLVSKDKIFIGASGTWWYRSVWETESGGDPGFTPGGAEVYAEVLENGLLNGGDANWSEWFTVASGLKKCKEIWLDFQLPDGLWHQKGGEEKDATFVTIQMQIQALDSGGNPTGATETKTKQFNFKSVDVWRETIRYATSDLGSVAANGWYRVRCKRVNTKNVDLSDEVWVDRAQWVALRAASDIVTTNFGDVTTMYVVSQASAIQAKVKSRQFSCVAQRRLPHYNRGTQLWEDTVAPYAPTSLWADGFVYRCKADDGGQWTDAQIDLDGIYLIQQGLDAVDGGLQGECNMTLDRIQPIETELAMIANIVRSQVYRTGQKVYVVRDEGSKTPSALFNRRNKAPRDEKRTMFFSNDDYPDAVELEWTDPNNEWKPVKYTYPEIAPLNPKIIKLRGITNWEQAWRRARYEWEVLQKRRDVVVIQVTDEGRLRAPLDVVYNVDTLDLVDRTDGEVLGVSGLVLTVDQDLAYDGGAYSVILRDLEGNSVEIETVNTASGRSVTLNALPSFTVRGRDEGLGTLYSYSKDSNDKANPYLIMDIAAAKDSYVKLTMAPYDESVYDNDTGSVPAQPVIQLMSWD